jgi:hypothetical protein
MITGTTVKERIQQFDLAHGDDPVRVDDRWLLFEDGAHREVNAYGALIDPPADNKKRLQLIVRYHEEKVKRAQTRFDNERIQVKGRANEALRNGWGISDSELTEVKRLQVQLQEAKKKLDTARKDLDEQCPEIKKQESQRAENRAQVEEFLSKLESIKA